MESANPENMSNLRAAIIILTVVFLIAASNSILFIMGERKEISLREQLGEANQAREAGQLETAEAGYRAILEEDPDQSEAALALFDMLVFFEREEARSILELLEDMDLSTEQLTYRKVRLHILDGDLDSARAAAAELGGQESSGFESTLTQLMLLTAEGNYEDGLPLLVELRTAYPRNRQLASMDSQLRSFVPDPVSRAHAKNELLKLINYPDEHSFSAAIAILASGNLPSFTDDRLAAARHLIAHPRLEQGFELLETPVLRGLASASLQIYPEFAYRCAQVLQQRPETTKTDQFLIVLAGQQAGEWENVREQVEELLKAGPATGQEAAILARYLILEKRHMEAVELIQAVLAQQPADEAGLRILLWQMNQHGQSLDPLEQVELAQTVMQHPAISLADYLDAAQYHINANPNDRSSVIDGVLQRMEADNRTLIVDWLINVREEERAITLLTAPGTELDAETFVLLYNAYTGSFKIEEARQLLEGGSTPLPDWQLDFLRARLLLDTGERERGLAMLTGLITRLPTEGREYLFRIAEVAEAFAAKDIVRMAYEEAHDKGMTFDLLHSIDYLRMLTNGDDVARSLRFAAYCRDISPFNPYYINNHTYLKLLSDKFGTETIADMRALVERYPEKTGFRLTLALAEMLNGFPGVALETIEPLGDPEKLPGDQARLSYAIVLAANGDPQGSRDVFQTVSPTRLMEAELIYADRYLRDGTTE